jgi:hypothetical protein
MLPMSGAAKTETYIQMRLLYSSQRDISSIVDAALGKSRLVPKSDNVGKRQKFFYVTLELIMMPVAGMLCRSSQTTAAIALGRVWIRIVTSLFTRVSVIVRSIMEAVKVVGEESSQTRARIEHLAGIVGSTYKVDGIASGPGWVGAARREGFYEVEESRVTIKTCRIGTAGHGFVTEVMSSTSICFLFTVVVG